MRTITQISQAIIAVLFFTISGCSNMDDDIQVDSNKQTIEQMMRENGNNPDEAVIGNSSASRNRVYVYTESNDPSANDIHVYRKDDVENLLLVDKFRSGGAGNGLALGSQGAVQIDANNRFLYAVNAGSKSISSFRIMNNGQLDLKYTVSSGGTTPVSLTIHNNILYVVNSGDGTINGFRLSPNGNFSHIAGSNNTLSSEMAGPAQISFSPNGRYLYVTEKMTNTISVFTVDNNGVAGGRVSFPSIGQTPFGFNFARGGYMVVSNAEMGMPTLSSLTSYSGADSGTLSAVNGAVPNFQTAACWVASSLHGRYAFVSNTGSDNLSSYYISEQGQLFTVDTDITSGDAPTDIVVAADNYTVYVLCSLDNTIQIYKRDEFGKLVHIGKTLNIPPHAAGLVTSL
jgi:6-phosphogluconolactonase